MIDTTNNKEVIEQLEFLKNRLHEDDSIAALTYAIKYLQPHNAYWIYQTTRKYNIYKCSHCGYIWVDDEGLPNYCCDCGYEMNEYEFNEEYKRKELERINNAIQHVQKDMDIQQALSILKDMYKAHNHLSNQDDMGNRKDSFKESADALAIAIKSLETPKYLYNLLQCINGKIYTIGNSEEFKETNCANCKYKNKE